ncbi:Uncharacterised protein [Escherichia coli]|uniref:Uncharacterized protein n=1 Tax=Escherichia coli TaxID=562 RepID=A0A377HHQ5_ECOLX|nr:Uncharacterised protein [Escherichia coli]
MRKGSFFCSILHEASHERAEGWVYGFWENGVMPGVPEVKFMGILTVYVLGGTEIYKKKEKRLFFFLVLACLF